MRPDCGSFKVYIQYSQRRPFDSGGYTFSSQRLGPSPITVFVEYNLFSFQARQVTYDPKNGILAAEGDVVVVDALGKDQRFESVKFKMKDGEALRSN